MTGPAKAVLFDLDGTLVDSAPDLAAAANGMREARGLPPLGYLRLRPMVGSGARGMLGVALGVTPDAQDFEALKAEFLQRYEDRLTQSSGVFNGVLPMLDGLEALGLRWGIVTNKVMRFARPLAQALQLFPRAAALVAGDSTAHAKPHPAPLLEAARLLGHAPADCWYVGDDLRDVQAGRAAGMCTVAVGWGYLGEAEPIDAWQADHVIQSPAELCELLKSAAMP